MQISEDLNFDKRAIYYWAKLVTEQLSEGMMFRELKKTVSINILDFNFIPDTQACHSLYKIINTATGVDDRLHDIFELHYIELRKFRKKYQELIAPLDRWITFLTRAHELAGKKMPDSLAGDAAIVKAVDAVDRMFNEEERLVYEVRMQSLADVESKIASAEEKGRVEGKAEGRAEGMAASLLTILTAKYGTLPEAATAQVKQASCKQLEEWMNSVFSAESLEKLLTL
jgi:predicted transposase/invertase (TIGR01784 family)